uniref:Cadherin domain-containing protein n=1 Tax=Gadus morhua TaxID=8049 RepID=A0A8C5C1B8_GADMO
GGRGPLQLSQLSYSVLEEVDKGSVVGNLAKDLNIELKDLEYRDLRVLPGHSKNYFGVDLKTGALYVGERIDREELCPGLIKCSLNVEAMLSNPVHLHRLEVNVVDINDNAPFFRENLRILNISESSSSGERYLLPMAKDTDTGSNSIKSYRLSQNEHFSLDVQSGDDQGVSADLVLQKALDREKQSVINLVITAFDGGKPNKSGTLKIHVNIIDFNDNTPIFSQTLYKAQVNENAPPQTSILTIYASDLDEGINGEVAYSFIERGDFNPGQLFSINSQTGEITVKGKLDFEKNSAYDIRIQAKDEGMPSRSVHGKVLVEIIDVNDNIPETIITSLMSPVKENAQLGTVVALVTVTDKDGGRNGLTHCKILGSVPFKLKLNYKNYYSLIVDGPLDREHASEYSVTIIASDEGSPPLSSTSVIVVHVSDVNDNAPRFPDPVISVYVKENSPAGATIYTISAVDPDTDDNAKVSYTLLGIVSKSTPISSVVTINSVTGDIVSQQSFNFEEVKTFQIKVKATDYGVPPLSSNVTVNLFILDENDNSPGILAPYSEHGSVNSENIPYSAEAGYFVAKIRAVDADSGYNALLSYHISEPKGTNLFRIGTSTGEIRTKRRMSDNDLKTHPLVVLSVINLVLTAFDGGKPHKSGTLKIVVNIMDVNDNTPIFSQTLYKAQVNENAPPQTSILTISASDLDEGINGEVVYSFIERGNFNPEQLFSMNSQTGEITVKGELDFEKNPAYDIRVHARDKGMPSRSVHGKVLLEVIDVNDNIPEIIITSLMSPVKEDAQLGTVVARVTLNDKDGGSNGLTNGKILGSVPFKLKLNYNNYYSLIVDGPLDRENASEYSVTIIASDEGSPPLSSTSVIAVHVSDVNDNAPRFPDPVISVYVKENSPAGATIYTISAVDPDTDDNAKVSYTLLGIVSKSTPISSVVTINSVTGEIVSQQSFNFEEVKTFQIKVKATDEGVPPLSSNVTVNVFILDENDNSPGILAPYSEHGSVNSENIPYSAEVGYFVAKIRAVDADSGYNALLSFHISEPKGTNLFRIGTSTGEIRTKRRMSDNDLKTHPLVVLVCDNGEPSLTATVSIDVVVVENTGDLQTQLRHVPLKEDSFSTLNLYLLIAIASVSVIFLLSLISLIAVKCHRTDNSFSRYSAPMITTHPDGSWSYSKSTQQYDVCFSSDTLKSDVVVFPPQFPPVDGELIIAFKYFVYMSLSDFLSSKKPFNGANVYIVVYTLKTL